MPQITQTKQTNSIGKLNESLDKAKGTLEIKKKNIIKSISKSGNLI